MTIFKTPPILFFLLISLQFGYSQNIKTLKDTSLFLECSQMPAAAPVYNLSFIGQHLDLDHIEEDKATKNIATIESLKKALEKDPHDIDVALQLARLYWKNDDQSSYTQVMEQTYALVYKQYEATPDDYETVANMSSLLQEGKNTEGILTIWNQYVMDQPKDVQGLAQFATQLAVQGYLEKAEHFTEQAYQIDPNHHDVYLAAMMCQFTNIILQLGAVMQDDDDDEKIKALMGVEINPTFFDKAIAASAPPAAYMGKDAAQMLVIFYRTTLQSVDLDIGKEVIQLKPTKADAKLIKEIEKRAKAQIKSSIKNKYFSYKILTTIEILKGNENKAVKYWKQSGSFLEADTDILRLLSFAHFLKMDFSNAILYLEKKLSFAKEYDDSYALGRFYAYENKLDKAFEVFKKTQVLNLQDLRATCAQTSILLQQKKFVQAQELMNAFPEEMLNNVNAYHVNYFMALCTLANGDMNDAFKRLKAVHAESDYKKDADKLLGHFFKPDKED